MPEPDSPSPKSALATTPLPLTGSSVKSDTLPKPKDRRANALSHGLTAQKFLPAILQLGRLSEIKAQLRTEFRPTTIAQELMIQEAARHFALLEVVEQAEPAVLRQAAQVLATLVGGQAISNDMQLAAAVTAEPLDRVARYRRAHEKGLFRAIEWLQRSKMEPAAVPAPAAAVLADSFATEQACEEYLVRFFTAMGWSCPQCGSTQGHWLSTRRRWECGSCHA